jgi:hypothetical protein
MEIEIESRRQELLGVAPARRGIKSLSLRVETRHQEKNIFPLKGRKDEEGAGMRGECAGREEIPRK